MNKARTLRHLSALLRGETVSDCDWPQLIACAGEELVLTELLPCSGAPEYFPAEVRQLLDELERRNAQRNARLFNTLAEVTAALNAIEVEPVLLKGCALWGLDGAALSKRGRILSDIDIMVRPDEIEKVLELLSDLGFRVLTDMRHQTRHPVVELGRGGDVGILDVHQRAPGPPSVPELDNLHTHCRLSKVGKSLAWTPKPEMQVLIAALHDQLNDGVFLNGEFNFRHLLDVAFLANRSEGVNWDGVLGMCRSGFLRSVVAAQLCAARQLVGADIPLDVTRKGRVHFSRQRIHYCTPIINALLRRLGLGHRLWRPLAGLPL